MNQTTGSSLCLTYGIENCVNFVASAVVLWRFFAPTSLDDALERNLQHREQRANVALGAIIVGLGLCLAIASMVDLTRGAESNQELAGVFVVSFFSIWFFAVLTCFKFRYAVRLESHSLKKDGICSLIGTILAVALLINTLIIASAEEAWWINPIVALMVGAAALMYGILSLKSAVRQGLPIVSCDWWRGLKEGRDEVTPRDVELPPIGSDDMDVV